MKRISQTPGVSSKSSFDSNASDNISRVIFTFLLLAAICFSGIYYVLVHLPPENIHIFILFVLMFFAFYFVFSVLLYFASKLSMGKPSVENPISPGYGQTNFLRKRYLFKKGMKKAALLALLFVGLMLLQMWIGLI